KFINNESSLTEQYMMADAIRSKLDKYWSMLKESTTIAIILDPSSKLITFPFDNKDITFTSLRNIKITINYKLHKQL
ncbi:28014_t:CDS:1, partial [Racocetra persica]